MKKQILVVAVTLAAVGVLSGMAMADTNATASPSRGPKPTPNVSCIVTAINTRDTAVIAARDAQYRALVNALQARMSALQAAWKQGDAKTRRVALKAAWQDYNNAARTASKAYNSARNAAWKQYSTDNKTCKAPSDDSFGGAGSDS